MNCAKHKVSFSPIGYWPFGVRPHCKVPKRKSRVWLCSIMVACSLSALSLTGCTQWVNNKALQATINRAIDASFQYLANNAAWAITRLENQF